MDQHILIGNSGLIFKADGCPTGTYGAGGVFLLCVRLPGVEDHQPRPVSGPGLGPAQRSLPPGRSKGQPPPPPPAPTMGH